MPDTFPSPIDIDCDDCTKPITRGQPVMLNEMQEIVHPVCPDSPGSLLLPLIRDALLDADGLLQIHPLIEVLRIRLEDEAKALVIRLGDGTDWTLTLAEGDRVQRSRG